MPIPYSTDLGIPQIQESGRADISSQIQPVSTTNDAEPRHVEHLQGSAIHEQKQGHMVYQDGDKLSEDFEQPQDYVDEHISHSALSSVSTNDIVTALPDHSTLTKSSDEVGVPGDTKQWHDQEQEHEEFASSLDQMHIDDDLIDNNSYGDDNHHLTDEDSNGHLHTPNRVDSDDEKNQQWHNLQASMDALESSTDTIASGMYTNPSDHADYDTSIVRGEADQSVLESSVNSHLPTGTIDRSPSGPTFYPVGDRTTTQVQDHHTPAFEEPPEQDFAQDLTQRPVTLRSGQKGYVRFLHDWTAQVTLPDGSIMNVDYDYFHDLDIDLPPEYYDYDYIPSSDIIYKDNAIEGAEDKQSSDQPEGMLSEAEAHLDVQNHETKLETHSSSSAQHETKNLGSTYTSSHDAYGEDNFHSYLDINSLQQRYQQGKTSESTEPKETDTKINVVTDKTIFDVPCEYSDGCGLQNQVDVPSSEITHPYTATGHPEPESVYQPPTPVSQDEPFLTTDVDNYPQEEETVMPVLSDDITVSSILHSSPEQLNDQIPALSGKGMCFVYNIC